MASEKSETLLRLQGVALELFAEKGFDKTSMRDIANAAELSVGAVQHYYHSKAALYDDCLNEYHDRLNALKNQCAAELHHHETLEDKVRFVIGTVYRFLLRERNLLRMRMRGVHQDGQIDEKRRVELQTPFLETFGELAASLSGRKSKSGRFYLRAMMHLVSRNAITSDVEMRELVGLDESASLEEVYDEAEELLAEFALYALGVKPKNG